MAGSLSRRIAVAGIGIPAAVGMIYAGGWVLVAALSILGFVGTAEFFRLAQRSGLKPHTLPGLIGAVSLPVLAFVLLDSAGGINPLWVFMGGGAWLVSVMAFAVLTSDPADQPVGSISVTIFAPLYAAGLPAFLLLVRHGPSEMSSWMATLLALLPLVTTWLCDTIAMAGGAVFGGPKFAPVISPNKTWSGAVSGVVGAGIVSLAYGWLVLGAVGIGLRAWQLLVIGLVAGVLGQLGDLAESLLKRSVGVKDSGGFFPGHGGVLDRLDSLYWVIPLSAMCLYAFGVL